MKKKCTRFALLFFLAVALCSITALAAGEGGIYGVSVTADSGIEKIVPQNAAGTEITETTQVDGKNVYMDAERIAVIVSDPVDGNQYLIIVTEPSDTNVPTADNIVYIDQKRGADLPFSAYPSALSEGTYSVWLASSDAGVTAGSPAGYFDYYMAFLLGYVDDDDRITATDAQWTLQMAVGKRTATSKQNLAANVDGDTRVTATDAQWILQAAVGKRTLK